jgi:hypothetical protein
MSGGAGDLVRRGTREDAWVSKHGHGKKGGGGGAC